MIRHGVALLSLALLLSACDVDDREVNRMPLCSSVCQGVYGLRVEMGYRSQGIATQISRTDQVPVWFRLLRDEAPCYPGLALLDDARLLVGGAELTGEDVEVDLESQDLLVAFGEVALGASTRGNAETVRAEACGFSLTNVLGVD